MKTIKLTKGYLALIDDEDFDRANKVKWYAQVTKKYVYAAHRDGRNGPIWYLHRFILNQFGKVFVDHKDHNTLNCQKDNLRLASNRQNQWNGATPQKRAAKFSQYKGVSFENGKWRARIRIMGKKTHLGIFDDEWEAAEAYNKKALELQGQFVSLNKRFL